MLATMVRTVVLAAMMSLLAANPATAAQSAGTLAGTGCLPDGRYLYKAMSKGTVRSITGGSGVRLWSGYKVQVRSYPTCSGQQSVLVRFRKGKVKSVHKRSLLRAADIDGNGTQDYYFDTNADGYFESAVLDVNGNGVFETFYVEDTSAAMIFGDRNENGYIEWAGFDPTKTGRLAWIILDQNKDGVAEQMNVDLVGNDGIADTWVNAANPSSYTPPGLSSQQSREANDMMVRHIVTMQQLRQFDPWDTNWYVPNGQTPSLLLPGTSPYRQCGAFCTL